MSATAIEWTETTWNPVTGCDRISPGCDHCYALRLAGRLKAMGQAKYQRDGDPRTSGPGFGVTCHRRALDEPMARLLRRWANDEGYYGAPNVWLGTSIESELYTFRADYLRLTPAAVRFLSLEPLLGPLPSLDLTLIDWVIVGGESGPGARPMDPDWARDIRDRCVAKGIPFFFKQWGGRTPKAGGRELDGPHLGRDAVTALTEEPRRSIAPDSHRPHGSYVKYVVERCGCTPCRAANRAYELHRARSIRRPDAVWCPYVQADEAREHIEWLRTNGVGLKSLAKLSGVPHGSLSKLVYGDPKRGMGPSRGIRAETARRILAVLPNHAAGAQKIPAAYTWRLLDRLIARGWTKAELARRLGQQGPGLRISRRSVRASTARAVERLYDEIADIPAPPKRTRWDSR